MLMKNDMNFEGTISSARSRIQRPHTAFNDPIHGHAYRIWRKKTTSEQIVSRDGVRRFRCRSALFEPSVITLTSSELRDIQALASKIEEEDRMKEEARKRQKILQMKMEREKLKEKYKNRGYFDLTEAHKQTVDSPESIAETNLRNKVEDLEETKRFNRFVVDIKCQAIREVQLQEKEKTRKREKEENYQYAKDLKDNLKVALKLEREREKSRKDANELAAKCLSQQIEAQAKLRQQNMTKRRQEEFAMSLKWKERLRNEREEEMKRKSEKKQKLKEEALKLKMETMKKREEEQKKEKLEHMKILEEQLKKQEEEDERKKKESEEKILKEQLKDLLVREKEREIEEAARLREVAVRKERELEERAWRTRVLQEAKEKKEKNERQIKEREEQLKIKQEIKLQEKMKEKEESKQFRHHSFITEERENRDKIRSFTSKNETKAFLEEQIATRAAYLATESENARREKKQLAMKQSEEEKAFLAYKNKTMNELRKTKISEELLNDLERRFQKKDKSIKKLS